MLPSPKLSVQANLKTGEPNNNLLEDCHEKIIKAFENLSYMGELRQRWLEIKKLLKGGLTDAIPAVMHAK